MTRGAPAQETQAPVSVGAPAVHRLDGRVRVAATIDTGARAYEAWYEVSQDPVTFGAEPFLAVALPVAMKLGRPLHVQTPVSPQLLGRIPTIQEIYHKWDAAWRVIPVSAQPAERSARVGGGGAACFFSGGVDSFYTLFKNLGEIDAMIFVHGFDIPIDNVALRARIAAAVREIARAVGKPLIEVETNLKEFLLAHVPWEYSHGALLAGIALLLSPQFSRVYIAASDDYSTATMVPWGSHPLLDPLWSTERTTVVHDGCEATRVDKAAALARSEIALRWLRVCWENPNDEYNCGRCAKCLRTMVSLRIVGALQRCRTFDRPLDLAAVARMRLNHDRAYMAQNLEAAERAGTDPELVRALRDCVSRRYHRGLWAVAARVWRLTRRGAAIAARVAGSIAPSLKREREYRRF